MSGRKSFTTGLVMAVLLTRGILALAAVKPAPIFADHMVLQRDQPVPVWGTAAAGELVTVSFAGQEKSARADDAGKWRLALDPLTASKEPRFMEIRGSESREVTRLTDIVVGDVWLCSGQSNMAWIVADSANGAKEVAAADYPLIRLLRSDARWGWTVCSPESVAGFSAVGYFFGRDLAAELDIPIGLICASVGATAIEQWTPLAAFQNDPEFAGLFRDYQNAMEALPDTRGKAEAAAAVWDRDQRPTTQTDPGDQGFEKGYARPDFDDSAWKTIDLPQSFESALGMELDGAVWCRRTVEVPERWQGKDLHLSLGPVDDFDVTYVNGVKIGSTGIETPRFHWVMRHYTVPAAAVKPGRNVIAVRVFDHFGSGGFVGARLMMRLHAGDEFDDISLAGPWRCHVEVELDPRSLKWPTRPFATLGVPNLGSLYGQIEWLIPYGIKGAIWYQGENNADGLGRYDKLLALMVKAWRAEWGQGNFPFLIVQLAGVGNACDYQEDCEWALLREDQFRAARTIENGGIATAVDIGEAADIHPRNKQDVGKRLALVALRQVYGKAIEASGPVYDGMSVENDRIRIRFTHTGGGLTHKGEMLGGFVIAGADGIFERAHSEIDGETVVVWSGKVPQPMHVRYGWAKNPEGANLYNGAGLPAFPFRTDGPAATEKKSKEEAMQEEVRIELGEPVTVALAPPDVRGWGPYQFPSLTRLPDRRIQLSFHLEADSAAAYGLPPARAVSADEGKTWTLLPREPAGDGAMIAWGSGPLLLSNGDRLNVKQLRSKPLGEVKLPATPFATYRSYGRDGAAYRLEDLPEEYRAGWMQYRLPAGATEWVEEQAVVNLPGQVRKVIDGALFFPWFQQMFLAPDGSVWAVNYGKRIEDGRYQQTICMFILRSTDLGRTWNLWSEVTYGGDAAADPKAAEREGFTEPTVNFRPDGSVFCLLRTTDGCGVGPLYWIRSTDGGRSWTQPAVFDELGVWPQMLTLENGVTLAVYGRPGLYVRATSDPAALRWGERVAVVPPAGIYQDTCSYGALLALDGREALVAYSNFNLRDADGKRCKGIQVRNVRTSRGGDVKP